MRFLYVRSLTDASIVALPCVRVHTRSARWPMLAIRCRRGTATSTVARPDLTSAHGCQHARYPRTASAAATTVFAVIGCRPARLCPGARRARAQSEGRRCRHPAQRAGGVHRRIRLRQIVAGLRHAVRRGAAALSGIGVAVCAAAVPPDGGAGGAEHRRLAAGGGVAAAARRAQHALVGRQRQHALEFAAHAVLARRRLSGWPGAAVRRIVFTQYAAGRVPALPWTGTRLRRDRALDGARRYADHPRARRGGVADRVAWPEPARHPRHARLRRRYAVARTAEEG